MDSNTLVIVTGLIAVLVALAAVQDSEGGWTGRVGDLNWSLSGSWVTTSAAVIALVLLIVFSDSDEAFATAFLFGLLLLFTPLIYRGLSGDDGASKLVFFATGGLAAWSSLVLLAFAAQAVPSIARSELQTVPLLLVNAAAIAAILAAIVATSRVLNAAAASDGEWTLP